MLTQRKMSEISNNVLMPYREMLYENDRAAKAFLAMGIVFYGAKDVLKTAEYYGVYDLPIVGGKVV